MSNPIAGWYPDPSGDQSKLRYWDGTSWTEHYAPAQGGGQATEAAGPDGSGTSGESAVTGDAHSSGSEEGAAQGQADAGQAQQGQYAGQAQQGQYAGQAQQGQYGRQPTEQLPQHQYTPQGYGHAQPQQAPAYQTQQAYGQPAYGQQSAHQPYTPQGQQPYGQYPGSQPYTQSPYAGPTQEQDPYNQQPGTEGGGGSGKGLVIGIIVAAVVLIVAAVIAVVLLLRGGDEPDDRATGPASTPARTEQPSDEPSDVPSDEPSQVGGGAMDGGELTLDTAVDGRFDEGGTWTATLSVSEPTPVVFDVVGERGDLVLAVSGGSVDAENDDRRDFLDVRDSSPLDPALALFLEPGEYEVVVSAYSEFSDGVFTLTAHSVELVAPGDTVSVSAGEDDFWLGAFQLDEDATVVLDTVATDGDGVLGLFTSEGEMDQVDDSDDGAGEWRDPYLRAELPAGVHFVSLHDYWGDPLDTELTISVE
ncbi:DUF2510 domain-containing protein [uncultured Georgenia sp.]|uniref:DUF2510 domain-containing protein n=1 Tax=uncultured Georgenia sp. TaxID=378209 RepID=UPI002601E90A|nr:DUF2510 domain-containing protein [uncultured Georgenia sp.]